MIRKIMLVSVSAFGLIAATLPSDHLSKHVNDFANIIPDDREVVLEQKLTAFNKAKTVQIAVVTTPSLDGNDIQTWSIDHARLWKIGHSDKNNGILITVAPHERKARVEVGYGLESTLTDAEASQFLLKDFVPAFRRNDVAGGLDVLTNAIIQKLSSVSSEEQTEFVSTNINQRTSTAEATADRAEFYDTLGTAFGGLLVLGGGAYGTLRIRRSFKRRREERERLTALLQDSADLKNKLDEQIGRLKQNALFSEEARQQLPIWAKEDADRCVKIGLDAEVRITNSLASVLETGRESYQTGQALFVAVKDAYRIIPASIAQLTELPAKVEECRTQAAKQVQETVSALAKLKTAIETLRLQKYTFESLLKGTELLVFETSVQTLQNDLSERKEGAADNSAQLSKRSTQLISALTEKTTALDEFFRQAQSFGADVSALQKRVDALPCLEAAYTARLRKLMAIAPLESVREFHGVDPVSVKAAAKLASLTTTVTEPTALQSSLGTLSNVRQMVSGFEKTCDRLVEFEAAFTTAKANHQSRFADLEATLIRAQAEVAKPGSGKEAERLLEAAKTTKQKIHNSTQTDVVDWIAIAALIETVLSAAQNATNKAKQTRAAEIQRQEDEVRRAREAQEEEDRERRRHASEDSNASSDYGFSGGGSDNDDSPSSGGDFGGGGADADL